MVHQQVTKFTMGNYRKFQVNLRFQCNTVCLTAPPMSWLKGRLVAEEVGAAWGAKRWKTNSGGQNQIDGSVICMGKCRIVGYQVIKYKMRNIIMEI